MANSIRFFLRSISLSILAFSLSMPLAAAELKPVELHPDYNHDRFVTLPKDMVFQFRAYLSSFDSTDDNNKDGTSDVWRIPEFVAYELRRFDGELGKAPKRPSPWISDETLFEQQVAPSDASYKYSKAFRENHKNWYDRGHLCAKVHAWRLGGNADWNTHTVLNAVPQLHDFNAGIWKDLEKLTSNWADTYETVWVIAGPVFNNQTPRKWIGEVGKGELPVAIPDGLFKIIIKDSGNEGEFDVLAFYYPHGGKDYKKGPFDHGKRLVSVDWIEKRTGLDFLTVLDDEYEEQVEKKKVKPLWE